MKLIGVLTAESAADLALLVLLALAVTAAEGSQDDHVKMPPPPRGSMRQQLSEQDLRSIHRSTDDTIKYLETLIRSRCEASKRRREEAKELDEEADELQERVKVLKQAKPPAIIVATVASLCQMVERRTFSLQSMRVLVIDEVDFIFGSSKQVSALRKMLTSYSAALSRQTIFASASIPQHNRFLHDCVQHKWTKSDVVHVHVHPVQPMPSHLCHKYVICTKKERLHVLLSLLERDAPKSGFIFVAEQSERSKKAGNPPSTTVVAEFLRNAYKGSLDVLLLEEDMNFNARAASFSEVKGRGFLLVSTDIASRGFDLPQTCHIYSFDLPKTATDYLRRAGRTGREPFSRLECGVATLITEEEHFVLQRFQNELKFHCEELPLESMFTFS
ncbi:DEAD-box ATP-dependent RNA helicase 58, chloroplastic-like isoform X1 [Miscanthus floridulus]|uniref:DEAD-box ATP-dependent RNA helicase 58, chloroplastic-like isoform X1 n=1 Tax=Miscanthus floridulus TaxID=154761 RepID=UPI0034586CE3